MFKIFFAAMLLSNFSYAETTAWKVKSGSLQYTLKHMLHTVEGRSTEVKGIGKCDPHCSFLVAAPLKSFSSDNTNRDTNMLTYTKAAANPMVELRTSMDPAPGKKDCDAEIKFAGKTHHYPLTLEITKEDGGFRVKTNVPLRLSDFEIERPALFGFSTDDAVPVTVDVHVQASEK